jgi:hypothetical protein
VVEPILEEVSVRWKLAEIVRGPSDGVVLEYVARLAAPSSQGALLERVRRAGDAVQAAELRSLEGLKGRG